MGMSLATLVQYIHQILNEYFWLPNLQVSEYYTRQHDDTDGEPSGNLSVEFNSVGDAFVGIDGKFLRFRTENGGGKSPHTRNALLILAEAIRLDNEERPQQ